MSKKNPGQYIPKHKVDNQKIKQLEAKIGNLASTINSAGNWTITGGNTGGGIGVTYPGTQPIQPNIQPTWAPGATTTFTQPDGPSNQHILDLLTQVLVELAEIREAIA